MCAEYVAQLGPVAISPSGDLLLLVVIVGGGEEVAEDHGGNVHLLLLVHLNRNATTIVPHTDQVVLPKESAGDMYVATSSLVRMHVMG